MRVAAAATGAVIGLLAGSYLTVLVARAPGGKSLLRSCEAPSGLWQRSAELATAALFAVMGWRFGFSPVLPAFWYLAGLGLTLTVIDFRLRRLPDRLTLPSYPVAMALLGGGGAFVPGAARHIAGALTGMAVTWACYYLLLLSSPAGLGGGDVKLSGVIGLYLGWLGMRALVLGTLGAFVLAGLTAAGLLAARRATRKTMIPFGPFMVAAALTVVASGVR